MTIRNHSFVDIERAVLSPNSVTKTWIETVQLFIATGWEEAFECPFCERNDLSILNARAGAQSDLRRWIFCDACGERVSIPAVCSN
jgi:transcription elongation factor Elf1